MAAKRRSAKGTLPPLPSLMDVVPAHRLHTTGEAKVVRSEWTDPDDMTPNASRTARTITGHRAGYTAEMVEAADLLRVAFDCARIGYSGLKDWRPVQALVYGPILARRWRHCDNCARERRSMRHGRCSTTGPDRYSLSS